MRNGGKVGLKPNLWKQCLWVCTRFYFFKDFGFRHTQFWWNGSIFEKCAYFALVSRSWSKELKIVGQSCRFHSFAIYPKKMIETHKKIFSMIIYNQLYEINFRSFRKPSKLLPHFLSQCFFLWMVTKLFFTFVVGFYPKQIQTSGNCRRPPVNHLIITITFFTTILPSYNTIHYGPDWTQKV